MISTKSSGPAFYAWQSKYGGLEVSEAKRLRALEAENAKLKRLLADELLNETLFRSLPHARLALDKWRRDYNAERPHSSLGWQTPMVFAAAWQQRCAQRDRTLPRSEGFAPGPLRQTPKTLSITQRLWFPMYESRGARQP